MVLALTTKSSMASSSEISVGVSANKIKFLTFWRVGCESEKNKLSDHFYEFPKNISGAMKIDDQDFRKNLKINVEVFGNFFTKNGKNECYSA